MARKRRYKKSSGKRRRATHSTRSRGRDDISDLSAIRGATADSIGTILSYKRANRAQDLAIEDLLRKDREAKKIAKQQAKVDKMKADAASANLIRTEILKAQGIDIGGALRPGVSGGAAKAEQQVAVGSTT